MRKFLFVPALALAVASIAGAASASDSEGAATTPKANWMTIPQITQKLTDEGYSVRQVKAEGSHYEVYAIGKDGKRLEGLIDPVTGEITGSESGEDD